MTLKLHAETKDYIWGGKNLRDKWSFEGGEKIAEAWSLSFHKDGMAVVCEPSELAGKSVAEVFTRKDWGKACTKFAEFPVLIKFIDSGDNLSVQVHPSDEYAREHEGQFGKTEMWYVVDSEAGAGLYVGFNRAVTKEEYARRIEDGTLAEILNFIKVKKGDCYFIPSGTVHAIGKGCTIVEVQQNSNVTYRVYDYNRVGVDGKPRELHIQKAKAVSDLSEYSPMAFGADVLAECKYFTAKYKKGVFEVCDADSFTAITIISGGGRVGGMAAKFGETFLISAGERVIAEIDGESLVTSVSEDVGIGK